MAFGFGKIFLVGEHAVVHGEPALAAALSVGVAAEIVDGPPGVECAAWDLNVDCGDGSPVGEALGALTRTLGVTPRRVRLDAELPAGAGLGSSAAMAVAAGRALAAADGATPSAEELADAATASERVFHGNPSGVDHTVAIHGGLLRYVRGTPPTFAPVDVGRAFRVVVAQVAPGANTGKMVAGVAAQRERLGEVGRGLHQLIGAVVSDAERAIRVGDLAGLGELMTVDHHLLGAIGVSTPALDRACHAARAAGALGAKLTGAGGGGCMIALVGAETDTAVEDAVLGALAPHSLRAFAATVG